MNKMVGLRTQKRRRRENKTDYRLRLSLLKSEMPRIVVRRTNKYFIVQAVESKEAQDKVTHTVTSKDLLKEGLDKKFSGSLKSIPAAYLTGLLFAKKIGDKKEYILDLGMTRTLSGSRVYAVVKGLIDGGLNVRANEKIFPNDQRIAGEHLKDEVKSALYKLNEKLSK